MRDLLRQAFLIGVALAALAFGPLGCGEEVDSDRAAAPTDGASPDGGLGDEGPLRAREEIRAVLRRVQRAFRSSDAVAVCAAFRREDLTQFRGLERGCRRDIGDLRARVGSGALRLPRPVIDAVRVYGPRGGVTMSNPDGSRYRVPFLREGRRWWPDIPVAAFPEALNGR